MIVIIVKMSVFINNLPYAVELIIRSCCNINWLALSSNLCLMAKWFMEVLIVRNSSLQNAIIEAKIWLHWVRIVCVGDLAKLAILLNRLVKRFNFPAFLVDFVEAVSVNGPIVHDKIKRSCSSFFVCEAFFEEFNGKSNSFKIDDVGNTVLSIQSINLLKLTAFGWISLCF